jgi:magnesium-transporting ATPase (P-type)
VTRLGRQGRREVTWTVLNSNAFDNNRKRTSVVVRTGGGGGGGGWGGATLLVKGADTCVMPFVDRDGGACPYFDETQARPTLHTRSRTEGV